MSGERGLPRQFYDMLMESQFWSPEQLRSYQQSQLSQLLRHARANVPFYQHRLDSVFASNGDIDWDKWNKIPILKRSDLVEQGPGLLATTLPPGHGGTTKAFTSGTSGAQLTLISTQVAHIALNGNRFRYYAWHEVDTSRDCCSVAGDDTAVAAWPEGKVLGRWGAEWDVDSLDGTMRQINRLTSLENILEFIERKRPAYLTSGPNRGLALALTAKRLGASVSFAAFLPHGEATSDRARAAISEAFGAKSIDLYSTKEGGHIAHLCPGGGELHVNAESVLVEIVDESGAPVPPGTQGRVIITPFFNAAQPLIRYDQGDLASWAPRCACGRNLPSITRIIGRSTTVFYHPDGRIRSAFLGKSRHLLNCEFWQIAQTGPTQFEVRYVPIDAAVPGNEAALAARMREMYFDDAEVTFRRVDAIPAGDRGKALEYVSEWEPPT